MKVSVFIPCAMDQFAPDTAANTLRLLKKAGCQVEYDAQLTCCGKMPFENGYWDESKRIGQKFLRALPAEQPIIVPGRACVEMVRLGYNDLFTNTVDHNTCRSIQSNLFELSEFLVNILNVDYFGAELEGRALYHEACHSGNDWNALSESKGSAEILLSKVAGLELIDAAPLHRAACGAGGGFSHHFPDLASKMAQELVEKAQELGAELIVSNDITCILHLQGVIAHKQASLRCMHLADVLTSGWPNI